MKTLSPPCHVYWIIKAVLLFVALSRTAGHGGSTCASAHCATNS